MTRLELLDAYMMVAEWFTGHALILKIDDKILQVVTHMYDDACDYIDVDTGEVMATIGVDDTEYTTDWVKDLYQWGK